MKKALKVLSIVLLLLYLFIPLIATFLFSICSDWSYSILPKGITFKWYIKLLTDPRFLLSIGRSFFLAGISIFISVILLVPSIFAINLYYPKLKKSIGIITVACYTVPGVILSVALVSAYANLGVPMLIIVLGAYIISSFPLISQGTLNSLMAIDSKSLMESAEILGASRFEGFKKVILPNITRGVLSSSLFSFSTLFGEFVIVNLLLGARFETIQIFLRKNMVVNGHLSSAIVIFYFVIIMLITIFALNLVKREKGFKK